MKASAAPQKLVPTQHNIILAGRFIFLRLIEFIYRTGLAPSKQGNGSDHHISAKIMTRLPLPIDNIEFDDETRTGRR